MNLSLRLGAAIAMTSIALAALLFHQLFGTAWSNHCDPGNAQFGLLKSDPVVGYHATGELFTWENDGPDNSWLCSAPSLSVSHVGPDQAGMFAAVKSNMTASGWTSLDNQYTPPGQDFTVYEKKVSGVILDAIVRKNLFWVEVDLDAPGLHPGENGF
jgi:hypothetical protein